MDKIGIDFVHVNADYCRRHDPGHDRAWRQQLDNIAHKTRQPALTPYSPQAFPVYASNRDRFFPIFHRMMSKVAEHTSKVFNSAVGDADVKALSLLRPQVGLTSGWACKRGFHNNDAMEEESKAATFDFFSIGVDIMRELGYDPRTVLQDVRVDKSHMGPTRSTGMKSYLYTLDLAMKEGWKDFPIDANHRHGVAPSTFFNVESFTTGEQSVVHDLIVRFIAIVCAHQSDQIRPECDFGTKLKKMTSSGKVQRDTMYLFGYLTLREYFIGSLLLSEYDDNEDMTLPDINHGVFINEETAAAGTPKTVVASVDASKFDLRLNNGILMDTADLNTRLYERFAPGFCKSEMGFRNPISVREWNRRVHQLPILGPSGVGDRHPAILYGPEPHMLKSGQPDTAWAGTGANVEFFFRSLPHGYRTELGAPMPPEVARRFIRFVRMTYKRAKASPGCKKTGIPPFRKNVQADDMNIAVPEWFVFEGVVYYFSLTHMLEFMTSTGRETGEEPLSYLRKHIIPGYGILPFFNRLFAHRLDPEYGYKSETLSKIGVISVFRGLFPDRYFNLEGDFKPVYLSKRVLYDMHGLGNLRDADEDAMLKNLSRLLTANEVVSLSTWDIEKLKASDPHVRMKVEALLVKRYFNYSTLFTAEGRQVVDQGGAHWRGPSFKPLPYETESSIYRELIRPNVKIS